MALLMFSTASRVAHAQPAGSAADSLGRPVFGFLRPTYDSNYSSDRSQTNWTQNFKFANQFGKLSLDNKTDYTVKTDPSRPDFSAKGGKTATQLAYSLFDLIPLTGRITFDRGGTNDVAVQTRRQLFSSNINGSYNVRMFRGARSTLSGGVGLTRRRDSNIYNGIENGAQETGVTRSIGASSNYNPPIPGMTLKFDTNYTNQRTNPRALNKDLVTTDDGPKSNSNSDYSAGWSYSPVTGVDARMDYKSTSINDSYIVVSRDTTQSNRNEVRTNTNNNLTAGLRVKPGGSPTTELTVDFNRRDNRDFRLVEVERASDRSGNSVDMRLRGSPLGNPGFIHYQSGTDEDRSAIRPSSTTLTRVLDGSLERAWNSRFTTRAVGELRLRSQKYSDGVRDVDQFRNRVEFFLTYLPFSKITTNFSARRSSDETINISSIQSRDSRLEENFGFSADIKYTITPKTRVGQIYNINELFTAFQFNPGQDNIQRNRDVATTITHLFSSRVSVEVRHQYKLRETGGYRREGGERFFARGDLRYEQDFKTSLSYKAFNWLTFRSEERFYRTDDIRLTDNRRITNARLEMAHNATFQRSIPGGGTISATTDLWVQKLVKPFPGKPERFFSVNLRLSKPF